MLPSLSPIRSIFFSLSQILMIEIVGEAFSHAYYSLDMITLDRCSLS